MPYGTVNLKYGVNYMETPITWWIIEYLFSKLLSLIFSTAGIGTFLLEFGALSRLTGNPHFERVALKALDSLWASRSKLGLVGNHIDVQTGLFSMQIWIYKFFLGVYTATDAGIGAGVDSYFEYLVKGALLFQRPNLMKQFYGMVFICLI
jgi:mannosidase alpha-like ER degradation enhancer 2